ncbi:hypothetical protein IGI04_039608 [Brassica rapa subsp. trilocularis]|uniref:Pre-mRNA-splicing factor Syf1/CRNKL1-like C-terminal HAT-repeats domain-containing protein n=1 Tax=Brassica rapa subsp. trilocularis TaxID=1813537 RepID=A0ABQ7KM37_BRACM|nr:hypothetical protein IGI04_039608 [Brassica rapa subsp. trilocularis]
MLKTYGNLYLTKFVKRYGKTKLERAIELHQMMYVRTLYLRYAKLKEDYGLAKQALKVYEEATKKVPECQRVEMCDIYIFRAAEIFGDRLHQVARFLGATWERTHQEKRVCRLQSDSFHSAREHMQKKDEMEDVEEVKWCKKTGVCEPATGNVEGTELPEECDDELLEKTKYRSLMKKSMMLWLEDLQERERKTVKKALKMVAKPLDALKRTNRHKLAQ